jgi:hypothetical protein
VTTTTHDRKAHRGQDLHAQQGLAVDPEVADAQEDLGFLEVEEEAVVEEAGLWGIRRFGAGAVGDHG